MDADFEAHVASAMNALLSLMDDGRDGGMERLVQTVGREEALRLAAGIVRSLFTQGCIRKSWTHPWRLPTTEPPDGSVVPPKPSSRSLPQELPAFLAADPGLSATFEIVGENLRFKDGVPAETRIRLQDAALALAPFRTAFRWAEGRTPEEVMLLEQLHPAVSAAATSALQDLVRLAEGWEVSNKFAPIAAEAGALTARWIAVEVLGNLSHQRWLRIRIEEWRLTHARPLNPDHWKRPLKLNFSHEWCQALPKVLASHPGLSETFEIVGEEMRFKESVSAETRAGFQDLADAGYKPTVRT